MSRTDTLDGLSLQQHSAWNWLELAVVCVAGFVPWVPIPILGLFIAAAVFNWIDNRSWGRRRELGESREFSQNLQSPFSVVIHVVIGMAIGLLGWTVVTLSFGFDDATGLPATAGSFSVLATVVLLSVTIAVAAELVCRGFVLPRVAELSGSPFAGNLAAAVVYGAAVSAGDPGSFFGFTLVGLGFGFLYRASGDRLNLPIAASATIAALTPIATFV